MEWKKAKSLLIAILLLANIFLISALISSYQAEHLLSAEVVGAVPDLMQRRGVSVSRGLMRRERINFINYKTPLDASALRAFAERAALGFGEHEDGAGAELVTVESFSHFSLTFGEDVPHFESVAALGKYLTQMAEMPEDGLIPEVNAAEGARHRVTFCQYIDGIPVYDYRIDVILENGRPLSAEGDLLMTKDLMGAQSYESDIVTALFLFADYPERPSEVTITAIYPVYRIVTSAWGIGEIAPGYRIETDEGGVYVVDATDKKVLPLDAADLEIE